jgi:hypothetical protein
MGQRARHWTLKFFEKGDELGLKKPGFISSQGVQKSYISSSPPNFSGVLKIPLF